MALMTRPSRLPHLAAVAALLLAAAPVRAQSAHGSAPAVTAVRGTVQGADIIRTARRYLGVRYVLGGETPRAFDCSGFVRYVFAQYGIRFPRTAHEQAAFGDAPPPGGDLKPGDLLFFYGGHGAQHIAIYIGGDSIIHASSSGRRVKLDRFQRRGGRPTWFNERLIAVRRVLPMEGIFYLSGSAPLPTPPSSRTASASDLPR